jgi:hypothetical protein
MSPLKGDMFGFKTKHIREFEKEIFFPAFSICHDHCLQKLFFARLDVHICNNDHRLVCTFYLN